MTAGGGVKGSGFFHRRGLLVFLKSGISFSWILACTRMTAGGVLQAVCFFAGGDASRFKKAVLVLLDPRVKHKDDMELVVR